MSRKPGLNPVLDPRAHFCLRGIGCGSDWRKYQFDLFVQIKTANVAEQMQDYFGEYFAN
jgi:hypothetical protein